VVAQSRRLKARPLGVTLLDRPIVLARLHSGAVLALDDCCPHRQVPLSLGRVTAQGLQCAYHGWTFAADGRCTAVPGLCAQACQPVVRVGALQVLEHDGWVWVRRGGQDGAAPPGGAQAAAHAQAGAPVPEHAHAHARAAGLPEFLSRLPAAARRFTWSARWNARALDALENFLDPLHTHCVHDGLVRSQRERQPVTATLTRSAGGLQVDYRGQPQQSGWLYRCFESPREVERAHFAAAAAGSAQLEYRYRNGSALYFTLHFSPQSESVTQVHGTLHVENRWAPAWAVRMLVWPWLRQVARQDQAIVAAQALNRARFGRDGGVSTELDIVRPSLEAVWLPQARQLEPGSAVVSMML
jgi:phenylpropionate dioxygenase-like ring-hydroxylating dioxygenase large terminal subunit